MEMPRRWGSGGLRVLAALSSSAAIPRSYPYLEKNKYKKNKELFCNFCATGYLSREVPGSRYLVSLCILVVHTSTLVVQVIFLVHLVVHF